MSDNLVTVLQLAAEAGMNAQSSFLAPHIFPDTAPPEPGMVSEFGRSQYKVRYPSFGGRNTDGPGGRNLQRPAGGKFARFLSSQEEKEAIANEFGNEEAWDRQRWNARPPARQEAELEQNTSNLLLSNILIDRETKAFAKLAANTDVPSITGGAGSFWDNDANDPLETIFTGMRSIRTGEHKQAPNLLWFTYDDYLSFRRNERVRVYFGDQATTLNPNDVQKLIRDALLMAAEVQRPDVNADAIRALKVVIGQATADTARAGLAPVRDFIADVSGLAYVTPDTLAGTEERWVHRSAAKSFTVQPLTAQTYEHEEDDLIIFRLRWTMADEVTDPSGMFLFRGMTENPLTPPAS